MLVSIKLTFILLNLLLVELIHLKLCLRDGGTGGKIIHPRIAHNWPVCLKQNVITGNQSVVFLGNPAYSDENNVNARNQKCEISSNQSLYLTLYPGECSTLEANESSVSRLLECAKDSNQVIKLNQVKVDYKDVSSP